MSQRTRNRLLDLDRLCWPLATDDLGAVQKNLEASLPEALAREQARREPCWTESLWGEPTIRQANAAADGVAA